MRLRDARSFNKNVIEFLHLSQLDNLITQVRLEGAADAAVLHPDHGIVTLDQRRLVNETLINVELRHVVDNDGTIEVLFAMLGLQDVLQEGGLPRAKESTKQGDGHQVICLDKELIVKRILYGNCQSEFGSAGIIQKVF